MCIIRRRKILLLLKGLSHLSRQFTRENNSSVTFPNCCFGRNFCQFQGTLVSELVKEVAPFREFENVTFSSIVWRMSDKLSRFTFQGSQQEVSTYWLTVGTKLSFSTFDTGGICWFTFSRLTNKRNQKIQNFPHLVVIERDTKRVVAHVFGIASRNITDCHLREEEEEAEEEAPWLWQEVLHPHLSCLGRAWEGGFWPLSDLKGLIRGLIPAFTRFAAKSPPPWRECSLPDGWL